jgi:hypothetical protein
LFLTFLTFLTNINVNNFLPLDFYISNFCFIFVLNKHIINMKKLITILALLPISSFAQTIGNHAHPTPTKDTLYLLKEDPLANVTFNVWKSDPTWNGTCPTIIFLNTDQMAAIKGEDKRLAQKQSKNKPSNN